MNFLNKSLAQINDLFRSMTPGGRIASGLLLAVVVVSVAYLFNHQSSSPDADLMGGRPFEANQLATMEAAFAKAGLSNYQIDGTRIRIPRGQQAAYIAALADGKALPRDDFGGYLQEALSSQGPFDPPGRSRELAKLATQRDLAEIIMKMHGIDRAEVLFDSKTEPGLSSKQIITASVSVKPTGANSLDEEQVQAIRQLMAGAIAGLPPNAVAVVDQNTNQTFAASTDPTPGADGPAAYLATKRKFEQLWEGKIRNALSYIPSVIVEVNADLNPELISTQSDVKVDPKTVPLKEFEKNATTSTQSGAQGGGRPGLAAQAPGANAGAALTSPGGNHNESDTDEHTTTNAASTTTSQVTKAGLTPKRVTVTVGVSSDYYESVWRQHNPTPAGAEPKKPDANALALVEKEENSKIQDYVKQLISLPENNGVPDPTPLVKVSSFTHIPAPPIAVPGFGEKFMVWLEQYWSTLGLGPCSLVMLRSTLRSVQGAEPARATAAAALPASAASGAAAEAEAPTPAQVQTAAARLKRRANSGPSLRDELVEIVHDDPDAAANILRNWIGSPG